MSFPPPIQTVLAAAPILLAAALAAVSAGCSIEREASAGEIPPTDVLGPTTYEAPAALIMPEPDPVAAAEPDLDLDLDLGDELGSFELTYYWMAEERTKNAPTTPILNKKCKTLAKVSERFAGRLSTEGSGRLRDGRVVNTAGRCDCDEACFFVVKRSKFGVGANTEPLEPFRTVAVDRNTIAINTMLYIPELDGMAMPGPRPWGGFVHDGCVVAGDTGGNVRGQQLDFFTAKRRQYRALTSRNRLRKVTVFDGRGRCEKRGKRFVATNRTSI